MQTWQVYCGDALAVLKTLESESVHCVVTSPPYWGLRNYGHNGQLGLEPSPDEYVASLVAVMAEARRVLGDEGTLWLNLGDSYNNRTKTRESSHEPALNDFIDDIWAERAAAGGVRMTVNHDGLKEKDLVGIPWSVAFALRSDGWYLRSEIIWHKKSCMPESVKDRPTKAHEQVFLLTKQPRYFYDADAIREKYVESTLEQIEAGYDGKGQKDYASAGVQNPSAIKARIVHSAKMRGTPRKDGDRWRTVDGGVAPRGEGANARSVWSLGPEPATDIEHFAVMPKTLARRCILAGSPFGGTILDPFAGSGTTLIVALEEGRNAIGIELNEKYHALARARLANTAPLLAQEIAINA